MQRYSPTQNLVPRRSMVEHFEREGSCACSMELSDLLDSDTLYMTDANTSEGDQSLDELMLAAYDSNTRQRTRAHGNNYGPKTNSRTMITQPTPPLLCGAHAQTSLQTSHHHDMLLSSPSVVPLVPPLPGP